MSPIVKIAPEVFRAKMNALKEGTDCAFHYDMLFCHTAIDWIKNDAIELLYCLMNVAEQEELWISVTVPRAQPEIDTVSDLWPIAEFQEREVFDMFGVRYRGHRDLRRILLEDEWSGFPLRKDYKDSFMLEKPQVEKLSK